MGILVITTGGTIGALPYEDPVHPPEFSAMPEPGRDLVREALARDFAGHATQCISLEPRDSKRIDDAYRNDILDLVEAADERLVLVTHGTDTILESANVFYARLAARPAHPRRILVLTGSMIPLSNGFESDGHANLGFALACLAAPADEMACVNIVLSDFDAAARWRPRLYPIGAQAWMKFYDADGRYNRIVPATAL